MKLKVILVLLLVLVLVSVAVADAKSKGGGGRSSSASSSFSSKATSSISEGAAKAIGISSLGMAAKSTKKKHIDDDLFENDTGNETAEQSPGMGVLPAFLAIGMLLLAWRKRAA